MEQTVSKFLLNREMSAGKRPILAAEHTVFDTMSRFFNAVARTLKALGDHVRLEIQYGDLNEQMARMSLVDNLHRPPEFPNSYVRMWLSNVP